MRPRVSWGGILVCSGVIRPTLLNTAKTPNRLVPTFPEWLSGTEPLPHTPGVVRPSALCL